MRAVNTRKCLQVSLQNIIMPYKPQNCNSNLMSYLQKLKVILWSFEKCLKENNKLFRQFCNVFTENIKSLKITLLFLFKLCNFFERIILMCKKEIEEMIM